MTASGFFRSLLEHVSHEVNRWPTPTLPSPIEGEGGAKKGTLPFFGEKGTLPFFGEEAEFRAILDYRKREASPFSSCAGVTRASTNCVKAVDGRDFARP